MEILRSKQTRATNVICFSSCGVRVAIEVDSIISPSTLAWVLPPGFREVDHKRAEHCFTLSRLRRTAWKADSLFVVGGGSHCQSLPQRLGPAINALRKEIHLCIAERARDRVFIHAGVVEWKGRAIICPGKSYAGKSTLICSMLSSGATYYSDEYAVFDDNGLIYPFPLEISLRGPSGGGQSVANVRIGTSPLCGGLILFTEYRKNQKWEPRVLTPTQIVLGLLQNSLSMRRNPSTVLRLLKKVALTTTAYSSERGEASDVTNWLETVPN